MKGVTAEMNTECGIVFVEQRFSSAQLSPSLHWACIHALHLHAISQSLTRNEMLFSSGLNKLFSNWIGKSTATNMYQIGVCFPTCICRRSSSSNLVLWGWILSIFILQEPDSDEKKYLENYLENYLEIEFLFCDMCKLVNFSHYLSV